MADADASARTTADPGSDEAILAELNERFDYASVQKATIIAEGDIDVQFSSGDTWNDADRTARSGRPTENFDQLSQYSNQLINSYRLNPRSIKVSPAGGGATDQTAELRANRIRQIEYDSHAQEVYTVAGENAATRGYGYVRITAEYEDATTDNRVPRLKAIPNPNQVLEDPDGESTSGADWQYLFFVHTITLREFRRDYPDATIKDFDPDTIARAPKWFGKDGRVQIAEYWYVTETPNPSSKGRPTRTVCMYLTNGVELLAKKGYPKKTEWKGTSIPFIACYGKIVYDTTKTGDARKSLQSYIRLGRSAAKAYNWTKSTELEALALPVKASLFAYEGQLDQTQVDLVALSTRVPVPLILAKATTEATGQTVLPLPQYGTRAPDIQSYEIAAESFRRDVQNALGRYSVQDHRQGSTKVVSGEALKELGKSGDLGTFHFPAHYDDMLREAGVKLNELLDVYDDVAKEVATRLPDGSTKRVPINQMTGRAQNGAPAYAPTDLRMDPAHLHTIAVSTGPAVDSEREANSEFADHVIDSPQILQVVGPQKASALVALAIKLKGAGALGDQMAEIVDPQQKPGGAADPQQLQRQLEAQTQQIKHAEAAIQELEGQVHGKQLEIASKEKIARWEIDSKERMATLDRAADRETRLAVAEISTKSKDAALFYEERARVGAHVVDQATQAAEHLHEATQADLDRTHAAEQAAQLQQHQAGMAAANAGAAADAQAAGHQQALEQGQQAADLAPQPEPGA